MAEKANGVAYISDREARLSRIVAIIFSAMCLYFKENEAKAHPLSQYCWRISEEIGEKRSPRTFQRYIKMLTDVNVFLKRGGRLIVSEEYRDLLGEVKSFLKEERVTRGNWFDRLYQRLYREFLAVARRVEKAKLKYRKVEVVGRAGPFKRIKDKLKFMKRKEPSRDEILFKYIKDKADLIIKHVKESEKHSKDIEESLPLIEDERIKRKALRYVRRSSYEAAKALNEMIKKVKKYDVEIDEGGLDIYLLEEGYEEYLE